MFSLKVLLITFICAFLCSCAVVPIFTEKFDDECLNVQKKVVLSVKKIGAFEDMQCSDNDHCVAQITGQAIGSIVIFPVSAIISGSIAVVGNTIYWINELGECKN